MKRLTVAAALVGLIAGATTACSAEPTEPTSSKAAPTTLTLATGFAIENLDPLQEGYWAPEFGYSDLLMKPLPGGKLEPWVLESLDARSDTVWTLKLRPGVTFQDGTKLDAANLAALLTFHVGAEETGASYFAGATAKAVDDLTVELTTAEPVPNTPSLLANESVFPLFDLAAYQKAEGDPAALVKARIYVGPYVVDALTPERMDLSPNPTYYGGTPALTDLTVKFVPDAAARIKAVQAGEADLALYPPTAAARQLANDDSAIYKVAEKGTATGGPTLYVNQRAGALADVRVRQALQRATDYGQISDQVMNGLYDVASGIFPSFTPFHVDGPATDPAAAGKLLDEAGWTRTGDATRTKDGKPLTLTALTYPQQPDVGVIALGWQAQLKAVGVDLKIREVEDIAEGMAEETGWDFGISNNGSLGMTGTDPVTPLVRYYLEGAEDNYGGIDDPALEALIQKVRQVGTADAARTAERDDLLKQIQQRFVVDQAHGWALAYKRTPVVVGPDFADYPVPVANLWLTPYR